MSELLTIDSISVSYGNIEALHQVSISVNQGDIVCLIGANGAGKSTLLKAIVGLEPITSGSISLDGNIIADGKKSDSKRRFFSTEHNSLRTDQIAAQGVALVPEGRRVFADMSVEENLDMGAFLIRDELKI